MVQPLWKKVSQFLKSLNSVSIWPSNSTWYTSKRSKSIFPHKNVYRSVHNSIILFYYWSIIALLVALVSAELMKWISYVYTYVPLLLCLPSTPPSHPSRPSQSPELSSLCNTASSHPPASLLMVVYTCQWYSPNSAHPALPLPVSACPFSVFAFSVPALQIWVIFSKVGGSRVCHTEWSKLEKEKQIFYINTYIWKIVQMNLIAKLFFPKDNFFNWNVVELQCCVSVWYTAKWFIYTYILLVLFSC